MLQHVPSWSSISQGVMPGGHHHPGFSQQDESNLAMQESLGEREDEGNAYLEELEFEFLLESTLMNNAWYAAPLYTYTYHEEDQFAETLDITHEQDSLAPANYISPWNAPKMAA